MTTERVLQMRVLGLNGAGSSGVTQRSGRYEGGGSGRAFSGKLKAGDTDSLRRGLGREVASGDFEGAGVMIVVSDLEAEKAASNNSGETGCVPAPDRCVLGESFEMTVVRGVIFIRLAQEERLEVLGRRLPWASLALRSEALVVEEARLRSGELQAEVGRELAGEVEQDGGVETVKAGTAAAVSGWSLALMSYISLSLCGPKSNGSMRSSSSSRTYLDETKNLVDPHALLL